MIYFDKLGSPDGLPFLYASIVLTIFYFVFLISNYVLVKKALYPISR